MLSPDDAFVDNGPWDVGSLGPELKTPEMLPREYAREAISSARLSMVEPTADPVRFEEQITGRMTPDDPTDDIIHAQGLAAGLAGVWARENTREDIWDSFARQEVFATTGTRIRVRVFAGANFTREDLERSDFAVYAYVNGVPMGRRFDRSLGIAKDVGTRSP